MADDPQAPQPPRCVRRSRIYAPVFFSCIILLGIGPLIAIYLFVRLAAEPALLSSPLFGAMLEFARWANAAAIIIALIFIPWDIWRIHRIRRRAVEAQGLACERCLYDLSQLAESGACPECGQLYDHDVLFRKWTTWNRAIRNDLAARTKGPPPSPREPDHAT